MLLQLNLYGELITMKILMCQAYVFLVCALLFFGMVNVAHASKEKDGILLIIEDDSADICFTDKLKESGFSCVMKFTRIEALEVSAIFFTELARNAFQKMATEDGLYDFNTHSIHLHDWFALACNIRKWAYISEKLFCEENAYKSAGFYLHEIGKDENNRQKSDIKETLALAESGVVEAQLKLGEMYNVGEDVPQDYKRAVFWFRKAAEQGLAEAQYNLGQMYYRGEGVPQDYKRAILWFEKAAKQGHVGPQMVLGTLYYDGTNVEQNYFLSYIWLTLASGNTQPGLEYSIIIVRDLRDEVINKLTKEQLIEAQSRINTCLESNYQNCQ